VAAALRRLSENLRVTLVLLPCQYASGGEVRFGRTLPGVDRVQGFKSLMSERPWKALGEEVAGAPVRRSVLHLGGDLALSLLLGRALGAPVDAFALRPRWPKRVRRYFVPDERTLERFLKKGVPPEKLRLVGHPAFDSVEELDPEPEVRRRLGFWVDEPVAAFLCGSRPFEALHAFPFFVEAARLLVGRFPELQILFPMAPTLDPEQILEALEKAGISWRGRVRPQEVELDPDHWARVVWDKPQEALSCCDLAVALPGTNNLQAVALRVPLLVAVPLNRAWEIPLDGMAGHLPLWIPGMKTLKKKLILRRSRKVGTVSLPNRLAGLPVVPELIGELTPELVAQGAGELYQDREAQREMMVRFAELDRRYRGASSLMARAVLEAGAEEEGEDA